MIDEVKQNASKAGEVDLKETKYVFDSGYYSVENIVKADKDELDVYIADSKDKNIYEDIKLTKPKGKISAKECTIVKKEEQIYLRCPGEKEIPLSGKKRNRQCDNYVFKIKDKEKCKGCKYYENCLEGVKIKTFIVKKTRIDNIEKLIEHSKKLRSKEGRKIYSRRMPTIEKTFAVTKEIFNFRRTYRRGKDKISTEWDLICSVYNLRRMFTLLNA